MVVFPMQSQGNPDWYPLVGCDRRPACKSQAVLILGWLLPESLNWLNLRTIRLIVVTDNLQHFATRVSNRFQSYFPHTALASTRSQQALLNSHPTGFATSADVTPKIAELLSA